jgi:hypothetical protein
MVRSPINRHQSLTVYDRVLSITAKFGFIRKENSVTVTRGGATFGPRWSKARQLPVTASTSARYAVDTETPAGIPDPLRPLATIQRVLPNGTSGCPGF